MLTSMKRIAFHCLPRSSESAVCRAASPADAGGSAGLYCLTRTVHSIVAPPIPTVCPNSTEKR